VTAYRLDTGVQARWAHPAWEVTGSVTNGTLSNPRVSDDNGGKQLLGRVLLTPKPGLKLGASAARGQWAADSLPNARNSTQTALGWDAEYSRDHWLVRTEWVAIRWTLPYSLPPSGVTSLRALGGWVEGRYRFAPRIFAAARVDRLGFSRVTGTLFEGAPTAWDAPVEREELAVGYYLQRNLIARFGVQTNRRDAGRLRSRTFLAAQIIYWF
jgi:hypothetical protein